MNKNHDHCFYKIELYFSQIPNSKKIKLTVLTFRIILNNVCLLTFCVGQLKYKKMSSANRLFFPHFFLFPEPAGLVDRY